MALGVLLGLALRLFIFTGLLTTKEIGLLTTLLDAANIFAAFIPLGSQSIFVRYLPYFKNPLDKAPKGLLLIGASLSAIGFLVFSGLFLFFREPLTNFYSSKAPLFANYIYYLIPLVFARVVFVLGAAYANSLKNNIIPLIIKEVLVRVLTGAVIIVYASKWFDLDGLVLLYVSIYFISGATLTFYLFRRRLLNFSNPLSAVKKGMAKEILSFGLFAVFTSTGEILIRNIDSVMITSIKGLEAAGIYSIAFFLGQIIELPRRALGQVTSPFIAQASASDNRLQLESIYHKSAINQFLVGSFLLICIWTNIDSLLSIIPNGEDYVAGKYVVLFIGLGKLFDMSMGVNGVIIQNSKHYKFNFYSLGLLAILGIITNLILIPKLGINGAAIASLISFFGINILKVIFIKAKFNLTPFNSNSVKAIFIALICLGVVSLIPEFHSAILSILLKGVVATLIFLVLVIKLDVSEDFNQLVQSLIKKVTTK